MAFQEILNKFIEDLQIEGELAVGKIDSTEKFEEFQLAVRYHGFFFTTRSSRKETFVLEEGEDGKKKKLPGRGSLMFKSTSDVSVPFFGYPFIVETTVYYTCSQGLRYYASKRYPEEMFREGDPLAKRRRKPKLTQKIGCQAKMTVKKLKVFNNKEYYVARDSWREKKAAIDLLRQDLLANEKLEHMVRYHLLLSMDTTHNHAPMPRAPVRQRKTAFNPARKVLKLHEQFQEALLHLNGDLVTKCTNMQTLIQCCTSLKTIINTLKDSIEKNDGIPDDQMAAAMEKVNERQLRCCVNAEKRAERDKKRGVCKDEVEPKVEMEIQIDDIHEPMAVENNENGQIIELPSVLDGAQVIWDPVNVSWLPDGQGIVLQQESTGGQRKPSILVQRRVDDGNGGNINVVSQDGQNYAIIQHGSGGSMSNIGVPLAMAKVVPPGSILTTSASGKKTVKRSSDMGVAIAIPAGAVDWNQANWSQQLVVSDQFTQPQTVWNLSQ